LENAAASPSVSAPQSTTNIQEPIVQSGGSSPATWDELEAVTNYKSQIATKAKKEEAEAEKAVKKESRQESDSEETGEETVKVEKSNKKQDDKKELAKQEQKLKLLKLKNGDSELELRADALVPVKIDGKTVEVPLQEALNRYSQQSHVDKKFNEYKSEKEAFEKDRKLISEALNKSFELLSTKKDLRGFIEYMGEAMGVDAQSLYQEAVTGIQKQLEEWQYLSPEERRVKQLEEENAYYKNRTEAQKAQREELKSRQALEQEVSKTLETYQMQQADLVQAWDDLLALGHKPESLTPEFLGRYHSNMKKLDLIETSLKSINPELINEPGVVEKLATYAIQTDANEQEVAEVIRQLYGETPEQKLAAKMEKNQRKNRSSQPKNPDKDAMFFDDI
jgi:hypothetical protein